LAYKHLFCSVFVVCNEIGLSSSGTTSVGSEGSFTIGFSSDEENFLSGFNIFWLSAPGLKD